MKLESIRGEILCMVVLNLSCVAGIVLSVMFLPETEGWILLFLFVIFGCAGWGHAICNNTCNVVYVDQKGIKSKKGFYSWEQAVLTVAVVTRGRGWVHRVYFADRELLTKEEQSAAKHMGMYINLSNKRLEYLLGFYNKQVVFVGEKLRNWYWGIWERKVDFLIDEHNSKY